MESHIHVYGKGHTRMNHSCPLVEMNAVSWKRTPQPSLNRVSIGSFPTEAGRRGESSILQFYDVFCLCILRSHSVTAAKPAAMRANASTTLFQPKPRNVGGVCLRSRQDDVGGCNAAAKFGLPGQRASEIHGKNVQASVSFF